MLFWSFALAEQADVPDVEDVEGWLALMRLPRCQWSTLWAAYCVAAVQASEMSVV